MTRHSDVLIVLSDQQRPDTMGCYGQRLATTPTLDGLAAEGTTFDAAFTVQPVCGPARASIQTGRWPTDLGCWRNGLALPDGVETLATRLGALGYRTGYVGKWHLASDRGPRLPAGRRKARFEKQPVPPKRRGGYVDAWVAADALVIYASDHGSHFRTRNLAGKPEHGALRHALAVRLADAIAEVEGTRPTVRVR